MRATEFKLSNEDTNRSTISLTTSPEKKSKGCDNEYSINISSAGNMKKRDLKSAKKNGLYDKSPALTLNRDKSPLPRGASGLGGPGF